MTESSRLSVGRDPFFGMEDHCWRASKLSVVPYSLQLIREGSSKEGKYYRSTIPRRHYYLIQLHKSQVSYKPGIELDLPNTAHFGFFFNLWKSALEVVASASIYFEL